MLFPSTQPPHLPTSTVDSQHDATTGYSISSYTRWPRSLMKTSNPPRTSVSTSSRRYRYQNDPFSDILHRPNPQADPPMYSTISPRRSVINTMLP